MSVQLHRRSMLALAAATIAPGAWSQTSADSTLAQVKQRGTLRVGVTQAPPWFSKDPKSGDWASGVGVSLGKAMAGDLGVKFEPVEVTWGNGDRRPAGQQDRHDVDDGRDARARPGGRLPEDAAALLLARGAGA